MEAQPTNNMPIALLLTYLPQLIQAGTSLIGLVSNLRTTAMQSGEWTDDHEAQFLASLEKQALAPEEQPDKK